MIVFKKKTSVHYPLTATTKNEHGVENVANIQRKRAPFKVNFHHYFYLCSVYCNSFLIVFLQSFASMGSTSFIVGIIGNIISILVFTSPIKTFLTVVRKKSTENYRGVPYITTLLSTSLWSFYGLIAPDALLVLTVNAVGCVFQVVYIILFLIYAPKDKKMKTAKLVATLNVGFVAAVVAVTLLAIHGRLRVTFVGILCAALTIAMYAAPLSVMKTVIKSKSVEYMPFLLTFTLFLNGGIWLVYAVLVDDMYVLVPNGAGFVLGTGQLVLYAIYRNKSKPTTQTAGDEEEGSAHLVTGEIEMRKGQSVGGGENGGDVKKLNLGKGKSLPKPSLNRQSSLQKLVKTLSLTPYELQHSSWANVG